MYILYNKSRASRGLNLMGVMHQSFVSTAPHLRGEPGNSRANVQGNYFLIVPAVPGNCRGFNIGTLAAVRFSVV